MTSPYRMLLPEPLPETVAAVVVVAVPLSVVPVVVTSVVFGRLGAVRFFAPDQFAVWHKQGSSW